MRGVFPVASIARGLLRGRKDDVYDRSAGAVLLENGRSRIADRNRRSLRSGAIVIRVRVAYFTKRPRAIERHYPARYGERASERNWRSCNAGEHGADLETCSVYGDPC